MGTEPAGQRAKGRSAIAVLIVLVALIALHNDFWLWNDGARILDLPVGLLYHVAYCAVVSVVFWWIVASARKVRE